MLYILTGYLPLFYEVMVSEVSILKKPALVILAFHFLVVNIAFYGATGICSKTSLFLVA
jgi:hypothetical protein